MEEIFWQDYFNALGSAINRLQEVIEHPDLDKNDFMQDASVQRFEFVTELFWKVLKKVLAYEKVDTTTPRDVISKAFQYRLIDDGELWLNMITNRNNTSHVYKEEVAKQVFANIKFYLPIYIKTYALLKSKYKL